MDTAADLLADLTARGIELAAHGDRLRYRPRSAVTPDLLRGLKSHKAELLAVLRRAGARDAATGPDGWPAGSVESPAACEKCGKLEFWWNPLGDRRCAACDPAVTAIKALESAERIRRRHRVFSLIGAAELLAEMKRMTGAGI